MHVTKPFAATGRGRRLAQLVNLPLKAQEFGRRKKLQEMILSRELPILSEQNLNEYYATHCNGIRAEGLGEENSNNWSTNKHMTSSCSRTSRRQAETNFSLNGQTQVQALGMTEPQEHSGRLNRTENPKFTGNCKGNQNVLDSNRQTPGTDNGEMKNVSKLSTNGVEEISCSALGNVSGTSSWADWERSVVVEGGVDEEDLDEFALVEDNDDLNDVIVQQYISALHDEQKQKNGTTDRKDVKITPTRVQQFSKLKSTINADSAKHPPGTLPNPPKGMNRWGGSELDSVKEPTGWGDIEEGSQNWYNDGVAIWDSTCAVSKVGNRPKSNTIESKSTEVQQSASTVQSRQSTKFSSGKVGEIKTQKIAKTEPSSHIPSSPNGPLQQGGSKGLGKTPGWGRSNRTFSKSSHTTSLRRTEKHLEIKLNNGQEAKKLNSTKSPVPCDGSVRRGLVESSGWGDTDDSSKNWYDDGSSLWDTTTSKDAATSGEWK